MAESPKQHARCSASSSERWLHCTAAPTYEAQFPDGESSIYAREGTLAHEFCALEAEHRINAISEREYRKKLEKLQREELYSPEMLRTAAFYADFLEETASQFPDRPYQVQEIRVDFSDYVPDGFGTCDCVMIGNDRLHITDYKHGRGVEVSAEENSQMMLYALGALKRYEILYSIKTVTMAIVQPRITEDVSTWEIYADDLEQWGESIKPLAQAAYTGVGAKFCAGDWCRFCKGRAQCRARAEEMMRLEEYMKTPNETLKPDEVGELLERGAQLSAWYSDLQSYALETIVAGRDIPGWKAVEGRSVRAFDDADAAFSAIMQAGYDEALLYERKPKSLSELEKMIGKKEFAKIAGSHIVKPAGKPTLVVSGDRRPAYNAAALDFAGVTA